MSKPRQFAFSREWVEIPSVIERLDRAVPSVLNLFYKDNRVVIRSRPRLLVKSGETASIDVGNEIPVITRS